MLTDKRFKIGIIAILTLVLVGGGIYFLFFNKPDPVPPLATGEFRNSGVFTVDANRQECIYPPENKCLVLDGELFYTEIHGFNHQEGFEYEIDLKVIIPETARPQDLDEYRDIRYELVEIIKKTAI